MNDVPVNPPSDAETKAKLREIHAVMYPAIREAWVRVKNENESELDPMLFGKISAVTFLQFASMLAVDCHMTFEQFLGIAGNTFTESYNKAPKFG